MKNYLLIIIAISCIGCATRSVGIEYPPNHFYEVVEENGKTTCIDHKTYDEEEVVECPEEVLEEARKYWND